ncbi:MAG: hypothetical protein PHW73_00610 [Atribacterota bacterium]|nr:hypothetical protein [Atribacterota bacterium]
MTLKEKLAEIDRLTKEVNDLEFYASTLEYPHQENAKCDLLRKANTLKQIAKQLEYEINKGEYEKD